MKRYLVVLVTIAVALAFFLYPAHTTEVITGGATTVATVTEGLGGRSVFMDWQDELMDEDASCSTDNTPETLYSELDDASDSVEDNNAE